jgi:hypothetical protein
MRKSRGYRFPIPLQIESLCSRVLADMIAVDPGNDVRQFAPLVAFLPSSSFVEESRDFIQNTALRRSLVTLAKFPLN